MPRFHSPKLHKVSTGAFMLALLAACNVELMPMPEPTGVSFSHQGLNGHEIIRLYQSSDRLLAATDQGLYTKAANTEWQAAGLTGKIVLDIAILDEGHYVASVREEDDEGIFTYSLQESTNAGQSWQVLTHNFGGEDPEGVFGLHYDSTNNALYATGVEALAVSYDAGREWQLLSGFWGGFGQRKSIVTRNPATNEIWYGGQNALEQMVLERYSLDTQDEQSFRDLLPSPSVIYGIRFDPENDLGVYVSGEGGLLKTEDNGESWEALIDDVDYRFYYDLAIDPQDPHTLYTGGWTKRWEMPQPLILEISKDGGATWTQHRYPDNQLYGGVRSILSTSEDDKTAVYLGLYGGGIMKVTVD